MTYLEEVLKEQDIIKTTLKYIDKDVSKESICCFGFTIRSYGLGLIGLEPHDGLKEDLCISVGIHGNETKPLKALNILFKDICNGNITLNKRLLIIVGNPKAIKSGTRFIDRNLNRLFNSSESGQGYEFKRVIAIKDALDEFYKYDSKFHLELHSAIKSAKYNRFAIAPSNMDINFYPLEKLKVKAVVKFNKVSSSLASYSYHILSVPSYTIEIDTVESLSKAYKKESLYNGLVCMIQDKLLNEPDCGKIKQYEIYKKIVKQAENHQLFLNKNFKNFDQFPKGYKLANDSVMGDVFLDEKSSVLFPNITVPIGSRSCLLLRLSK